MGLLVQQIQGGDFLFRRVVFPMLLHTFSPLPYWGLLSLAERDLRERSAAFELKTRPNHSAEQERIIRIPG